MIGFGIDVKFFLDTANNTYSRKEKKIKFYKTKNYMVYVNYWVFGKTLL